MGIKRSSRAKELGYYWRDGKLSGRTLFRALRFCGIDPEKQHYFNMVDCSIRHLKGAKRSGLTVVAMGNVVSTYLEKHGVNHLKMVHPAARGKIRKLGVYEKHVKAVLVRGRK